MNEWMNEWMCPDSVTFSNIFLNNLKIFYNHYWSIHFHSNFKSMFIVFVNIFHFKIITELSIWFPVLCILWHREFLLWSSEFNLRIVFSRTYLSLTPGLMGLKGATVSAHQYGQRECQSRGWVDFESLNHLYFHLLINIISPNSFIIPNCATDMIFY